MKMWTRSLALIVTAMVPAVSLGDTGKASTNQTVSEIFRASPQDVLELRRAMKERQDAMYQPMPVETEITPKDEMVSLRLVPEEGSPTVHLNFLSPTVIQVFDGTGEPWTISDMAIVNNEFVQGRIVENDFANSIILYNLRPKGVTFLTVFLKDQPIPINIRVVANESEYHRNLRIRIQDLGPNAKLDAGVVATAGKLGLEADEDLQAALAGTTPYEATPVKSSRPDVMAWRKGGDLLLRTRLNVFSPEIKRVESGQRDFKAYRLVDASRVLASDNAGSVVSITLNSGASADE